MAVIIRALAAFGVVDRIAVLLEFVAAIDVFGAEVVDRIPVLLEFVAATDVFVVEVVGGGVGLLSSSA